MIAERPYGARVEQLDVTRIGRIVRAEGKRAFE